MVAPDVHAQLDIDLSPVVEKFDQPLFPLCTWGFMSNPNDVCSGLHCHVFDVNKRTNAEFQVQIGPTPVVQVEVSALGPGEWCSAWCRRRGEAGVPRARSAPTRSTDVR
ncbi:hypothetical protein [Lentzea terrae]|uniref:hypothetical protein n=1 Tax=Lentzea terrae TaxID=2200761 RepID=UPI0013005859|nr:hypothetical protein [Lentzea terrae]